MGVINTHCRDRRIERVFQTPNSLTPVLRRGNGVGFQKIFPFRTYGGFQLYLNDSHGNLSLLALYEPDVCNHGGKWQQACADAEVDSDRFHLGPPFLTT